MSEDLRESSVWICGSCGKTSGDEDRKQSEKCLDCGGSCSRYQRMDVDMTKPKLFKEGCFGIRSEIELIKSFVVNWMKHPELKELCFTEAVLDKKTEIYSNLKLSFRHLEDARMRIGKVLQAYDGGKSILDK
jgi:hypothetical protein